MYSVLHMIGSIIIWHAQHYSMSNSWHEVSTRGFHCVCWYVLLHYYITFRFISSITPPQQIYSISSSSQHTMQYFVLSVFCIYVATYNRWLHCTWLYSSYSTVCSTHLTYSRNLFDVCVCDYND